MVNLIFMYCLIFASDYVLCFVLDIGGGAGLGQVHESE